MAGLSGNFFHLVLHANIQRKPFSCNCPGRFRIAEDKVNYEDEERQGADKNRITETEEIILPASYVTAFC